MRREPVLRQGLGLDISLRHGVLMHCLWDITPGRRKPLLVEYDILFQWTIKQKNGLNEQSGLEDIRAFSLRMLRALRGKDIKGVPMAVDWDGTTAFWGRRRSAVTLALMTGYVCRMLEMCGVPTVTVTPAHVRSVLEVANQSPKEELWERMLEHRLTRRLNSDQKDAIILSYIVARSLRDTVRQVPKRA